MIQENGFEVKHFPFDEYEQEIRNEDEKSLKDKCLGKFGSTGTESGVFYQSHLADLLQYGKAIFYEFWKLEEKTKEVKEVNYYIEPLSLQQVMIIIRLYDDLNETTRLSVVSRAKLAHAIRINKNNVTPYLSRMLGGEFICPFCDKRFEIIKRGPNFNLKKGGQDNHSYKLDEVRYFIAHLTFHKQDKGKQFWEFVEKMQNEKFFNEFVKRYERKKYIEDEAEF